MLNFKAEPVKYKYEKNEKSNIYIICCRITYFGACNDQLETNPTDKVSGTIIFSDANGAETAMNGIYRATYVAGWGYRLG